jgi:hypothetical protein
MSARARSVQVGDTLASVSEFLDWLQSQGVQLVRKNGAPVDQEALLARFLGVDLDPRPASRRPPPAS